MSPRIVDLKRQVSKLRFGWLCWGLTSQSTIFQSCRDGAIASWVINQYFRGVKCLAQGHNTAAVGLEPRTSRSRVRHSTTEPPRSPSKLRRSGKYRYSNHQTKYRINFSWYILPLVYNIWQSTAEGNFSHTTKIAGNHWLSEDIGEMNAPLTAKVRGFLCK